MEQEKELLDLFRRMERETKELFLANARIALIAGETIKRKYGITEHQQVNKSA